MKESPFYKKLRHNTVECFLCEYRCVIKEGKKGICKVRKNIGGKLFSLNYGKIAAATPDPVEKKPLFHFLPGSYTFSIACQGCNFSCKNCQNWTLSQEFDETIREFQDFSFFVQCAEKNSCLSLSYTYSEPTIYAETALETAEIAVKKGLKNIFVTNGYESSELIEKMDGLIHGANVDLKSFSSDFYKRVCGGADRDKVLRNIELMLKKNIWVEVTTLVIPGKNDSTDELRNIADFLAGLGNHIPWHVSAFHPAYKMTDTPYTSHEILQKAWEIGREAGLHYVYVGNVPGSGGENTHCKNCGTLLLERFQFQLLASNLSGNRCKTCNTILEGVF